MKRDWSIIRTILLTLESSTTPTMYLNAKAITQFDEQAVAYHMRLLSEAGYIKAVIQESMSGEGKIGAAMAKSMTNAGHELLDTIRSDTVWGKIQEKIMSRGLEMTIDAVMLVGKKVISGMLNG